MQLPRLLKKGKSSETFQTLMTFNAYSRHPKKFSNVWRAPNFLGLVDEATAAMNAGQVSNKYAVKSWNLQNNSKLYKLTGAAKYVPLRIEARKTRK